MKGSVFISYRREGGDLFASILYRQLKKKNFDVYLDIHNSRQGDWLERTLKEVRARDYIAVVLSSNIFKDWNSEAWKREDDIVFRELDEAVKANKKFVPIMLKGFVIPDPMSFPDDGRREIIKTIRENEIFDFSSMRTEKKNWRDLLKFFYEDTVHPPFIVLGVLALVLVIGGMLLLNILRDAKDPPSDPETQGQNAAGTESNTIDRTEALDSDRDEKESDTESTENGNEANGKENYKIHSFLVIGKSGTMSVNETFLFTGKTNSTIVKLYIVYPEREWSGLKTIVVENGLFSYETQGLLQWKDATHIAVVPYDDNGNELRENALLRKFEIEVHNPLFEINFDFEQYGTVTGDALLLTWSIPKELEGLILTFDIWVVDKEKFECNLIDPVLMIENIQGSICRITASDMLNIDPGEYVIMLLVASNEYPSVVRTTDLRIFNE